MGEMPLELRRLKWKLVYVRLQTGIQKYTQLKDCYSIAGSMNVNLNSFGWRANKEAHQTEISNCNLINCMLPATPPW